MAWKKEKNYIYKEFEFDSFVDAVVFVGKITRVAEELEHHPDVLIHSYNMVKVMTTTHDEGRVTEKDRELAKRVDSLL